MSLASCAKQDLTQTIDKGKIFTAVIEQSLTKTTFTDANKVWWESGDRVNINGAEYSAVPMNPASKAEFRHLSGNIIQSAPFNAIFPASLVDADGDRTFPALLTYAPGKLDSPMYAESDTEELSFKNICGVLHFSLTGTDKVKSIIVTANENICGPFSVDIDTDGAVSISLIGDIDDEDYKTVTLSCGDNGVQLDSEEATDFYISLPPQTYTPGMTITINSTDPMTSPIEKITTTDIDIDRNTVYNLEWEVEFAFVPPDKNLGAAIETATGRKRFGQRAILMLENDVVYDLEKAVDAGLVNLVINGNGAVVNVLNGAQIAGMQGIEINSVNFNCAANTTTAPIALSANPDDKLSVSNIKEEGTTFNSSTGYYNLKTVSLNNCNFSEVKTSLISNNKQSWNLKTLVIRNSIVQFDVASGIDSYINWSGGSYGSIKDIIICGSTLYNIVTDNSNLFLHFANASNSQAQKRWPSPQFDAQESWTMENNTFVNLPSNKKFADQYPSKNNVTLNWTGNIFYNVYRLQNASQNAVRTFTAADNAICGITNPVYAADKSAYATEDTPLCEGDGKFVVPATPLDLNSPCQLEMNFQPSGESYAGQHRFGDPRWLASQTLHKPTWP